MPPRKVPCKFFQQGNCRFGDQCKFDHTPSERNFSNDNRFAPLQSPANSSTRNDNGFQGGGARGNNRFQQGGGGGGGNGFQGGGGLGGVRPAQTMDFALDKTAIRTDLTNERPQWILSAYGPGRWAPEQLFGGPVREQSFEEMRLLHYKAGASGNEQQAIQNESRLVQDAEQQIQNAANNIDGAIKYVIDAKHNHPNRIDICNSSTVAEGGFNENSINQGTAGGTSLSSNPFEGNSFGTSNPPPTTLVPGAVGPVPSAFGQPSGMGQRPSPFGGAPAQQNTGVFGQPSGLVQRPSPFGGGPAQPSTGVFGQQSGLEQKPGAFGGGPAQQSAGIFGQPSGIGQKPNVFGGGTAQPNAGVFGQPSGLGQRPSVFGGAPAQATTSVFGQLSGSAQQSNGSAPSNQNNSANPFGGFANKGNALNQPPQPIPSVGFGQPTQSNPFGGQPGQNPAPQIGVFGQPSSQNPLANLTPHPNPLGARASPHPNPFGQGVTQPNAANPFNTKPDAPVNNPFARNGSNHPANTAEPSTNGVPANEILKSDWEKPKALNDYASVDGNRRLTIFNGEKVIYRDGIPGIQSFNGSWKRIWNPRGPVSVDAQTEIPEPFYDASVDEMYKHLRQNGTFLNGIMPMIPPKVEWCRFDF